ncbi:MAG TPA: FAD-binding oxidoreductase [Thermomicrobiales bacterium]|nr:FAD-binding oxidoreductase [Thermomicrobiales bacterium]
MVISQQRIAVLSDMQVRMLSERLRGNVIRPGGEGYDAARNTLNAKIDRYPALVVQVKDAEDVAQVIRFARKHGVEVSVKSGGHGVAGHAIVDDAILIDLSLLKSVEVDEKMQVARAGAGLRAGEYVRATEAYGLVSPVGDASTTGLGGLVMGGGFGFLSGKHGLVVDNLLAAEIVTADGEILRASKTENPDLFWAIRGGGGNFGVVTAYEFQLHPLPQVLGGMMIFPFERAAEIVRLYRDIAESAPDELTMYLGMATMPDGMSIVALMPVYSGEIAEGERLLAPFREAGPVSDMVQPMPYSQASSAADPFAPPGFKLHERWDTLYALPDDVIDGLIERATPGNSLGNVVVIKVLNGAATRVDPAATAFPHRNTRYAVLALAAWLDEADEAANIAWAESVKDVIAGQRFGSYVNASIGNPLSEVFGDNYSRLAAIKAAYDPDNMFHGNVNITPGK